MFPDATLPSADERRTWLPAAPAVTTVNHCCDATPGAWTSMRAADAGRLEVLVLALLGKRELMLPTCEPPTTTSKRRCAA